MDPIPADPVRQQIEELRTRLDRLERLVTSLVSVAHDVPAAPAAPVVTPVVAPMPAQATTRKVETLPPLVPRLRPETPAGIEQRIGSHFFNRIGILAILIGMAWFLKFAFDNQWIGPAGRVTIGLLVGVALIGWSERFRLRGYDMFSYSLKAIGSGVLYLALWAAFGVYHLIPSGVAFSAMILVTTWNGFIAWRQQSELLAAYALAGGFGTPVLVSTGENHQLVLFSYVLILDLAVFALVMLRPWARLLYGAFFGTFFLVYGWAATFYTDELLIPTAPFIALFCALFTVIPHRVHPDAPRPNTADNLVFSSLPLVGAFVGFLSIYAMLDGRVWAQAWTAVAFGAFHLALVRLPAPERREQHARLLDALHLSIAVGFVTVALPIAMSGYWLAASWLIEGAAIIWVARRFNLLLLRVLAVSALTLGTLAITSREALTDGAVVFNAQFGAYLIAIAAFVIVARLAYRPTDDTPMETTARSSIRPWSFTEALDEGLGWRNIAIVSVIVVNVLILVAVALEIHHYWALQGLASSTREGFSYSIWGMLFGAGLLGIGFRKRSAFFRWQALLLIALSIFKVFLFDASVLSQGYRILSFLVLGVLLLGISFAYQRDWLGLKPAAQDSDDAGASVA
jgi:uncharacterized membrane protein